MRVSLDWLKDFVDTKGGLEKIQHSLTMTGLEVTSVLDIEDDKVMDIEITPNRPDCLSIIGVARELAASINKSIDISTSIKKNYMKKGSGQGSAKVEVLDKKACPRYVGCIIKNVKVGASPKWLVSRLNSMGVRSVNNIADITNYVLFETGQPLHAFDLDKLAGSRIIVRKAKKGESIVTIDGVKRELDPTMLIIADMEKPVAIAGIMGGKDTEITERTKTVLLESAYFDPISVRRAQRKLGLASESSYRFERGVDFSMVLAASVRTQELIRDEAGGRVSGTITDVGGKVIKENEIKLCLDEIPRILGIEIPSSTVIDLLKRLEIKTGKKTKDAIIVKIPCYRQDLEREIDLIEEVARLYGYDNIPSKHPVFKMQKTYEEERRSLTTLAKEIRNALCSLGMNEIVSYTLTSRNAIESLGRSFDNAVRLRNPLSSNQEFMRPSLISEMLEVMSWNINRRNSLLQLFELNKVYTKDQSNNIKENLNLCLGLSGFTNPGWKGKATELGFFDLKGIVEMLFHALGIEDYSIKPAGSSVFRDAMSSNIKVGEDIAGELGEVRSDTARKFDIKEKVFIAEIDAEILLKHVRLQKRFSPLPRYPSVTRDISMVIDEGVSASSILDLIKDKDHGLVKAVNLFDLYKGQQIEAGKKSLAYTLEYRSDEKTLKEEDISQIHKDIQDLLVEKLGAQIR